jgi:protein-disulfide isomerase
MKRNALLKRVLAEHEEEVRIVFKHFPFVSPEYSEQGSIAAMAAQRQDRFWEYVDALYEHRTDPWTEAKLIEYAKALGLDSTTFAKDLNDPSLRNYVRYDRAAAEELNIRATPTLLVNGLVVPNWANAADIRKMIRASKREVVELVRSGQASDVVEARAKVAAKNHPAGEEFARRYMYNDVSDLGVAPASN